MVPAHALLWRCNHVAESASADASSNANETSHAALPCAKLITHVVASIPCLRGGSMESVTITTDAGAWYTMLFRTNPLPMLVFQRGHAVCLDANAGAARLFGKPVEQLKGTTLLDLLNHADLAVEQFTDSMMAGMGDGHLDAWRPGASASTAGGPRCVQLLRHTIRYHAQDADLLMLHDVTAQRHAELALRTLERDLSHAQAVARLGCFVRELSTAAERWSDQMYRNLGLEPRAVPAGYDAFLTFVHPDDRSMVQATLADAIATLQPYACVHRVVWPDGSVHVMQHGGEVICDGDGAPLRMLGTMLDVTRQHQVEAALRQTQDDLKRAQEVGHIGTWAFDPQTGAFDSWSDETFRIFGFPMRLGMPRVNALLARYYPDDRERVGIARERALADPGFRYDIEFRIWNPQRGERVVHSVADVQFKDGKATRMVGMLQDITDRKRAEEEVRHLAFYDTTTGLPNRVMFETVVEQALEACRRDGAPASMLVINLDRFRDVNYTLGHADGDAILKQVGMRISEALGPEGFVARVGNAQFAAVLPGVALAQTPPRIRAVFAALERPFPISGICYELGANIGLSGAPEHADDVKTFIRRANVAQYQARQMGQAYAIYDPATDPYNPRRLALIGEFRKSVKAGQLQLYCQPKVDLRTRMIVGAEALVRWQHPVLGMVPPDQFVPQIEATDLIHELTRAMLDRSVAQVAEWRRRGVAVPMAVNVSPRNLMEPEFVARVQDMLESSRLPPEALGLEITESSLIADPKRTIAELQRLDAMGLPIFVDDFGTGYSSLSYLISLPVDVIKIDHSFTMHMIDKPNCAAVVRSTVDLAHSLGMTVVAEGTASREIWDALAELGCDQGQGHFISPPLPAAQFMAWSASSGIALQPA
ncbi:EAL domain-containing protein [Oxalobacteraceae bacterium OM1]|nr:EAL domain-containing protein [Oxalobacteraceae bacterium OM1]